MSGNFPKLRQEAREALPAEWLPPLLAKAMKRKRAKPGTIITYVVKNPKTAFQIWMRDMLQENGAYPTDPNMSWEVTTTPAERKKYEDMATASLAKFRKDKEKFWAKYGL